MANHPPPTQGKSEMSTEEENVFRAEIEKYGKMGMAESFADVAVNLHRIEKKIVSREELVKLLDERLGHAKP
jgi:hypothetical protein